jgi:SAM-dependent methyltransferase
VADEPDFTDADSAELYDVLNPWNDGPFRDDAAFYDPLVLAAASVLDVGCGTGSALHAARAAGHTGRLVGIDPDMSMLARARRHADIEWFEARAADVARWAGQFDLAIMTSNAFQCLVEDDDLRASLAAVRTALRPGGRFAFETRHPQARAWESWPEGVMPARMPDGRDLRISYQVDSVVGDRVTFAEITALAGADGQPDRVVRTDRAMLRFLDVPALNAFLGEAGFEVDEQYGSWDKGPLTAASSEIVTVARRA